MSASRFASVRRNVLASSTGQILASALSVGTTIVTARWLGASGRGTLSLLITGAMVLALLVCVGIPQAITTFTARGRLTFRRAGKLSALVAAGTLLVGIATAIVMVRRGDVAPEVAVFLPLGALAGSLSLSQVMLANGVGRVDLGVLNTAITAGTLLGAYTIGWLSGLSGTLAVVAACASWVAGQFVGDAVGWWKVYRASRDTRRVAAEPVAARELWRYAASAYPSVIVGHLNARLDILLLGVLAGTAAVGLYSTAVVAASLVFVVPSAIGAALSRPFGDHADEDAKRAIRVAAIASWGVSGLVGLVLWGAVMLLAEPLLGAEFASLGVLVGYMLPGMVLH
ncbi:MAG: lipopolysaccharide biosynthesis protein, partial [Actinobacteria bacterium]